MRVEEQRLQEVEWLGREKADLWQRIRSDLQQRMIRHCVDEGVISSEERFLTVSPDEFYTIEEKCPPWERFVETQDERLHLLVPYVGKIVCAS